MYLFFPVRASWKKYKIQSISRGSGLNQSGQITLTRPVFRHTSRNAEFRSLFRDSTKQFWRYLLVYIISLSVEVWNL